MLKKIIVIFGLVIIFLSPGLFGEAQETALQTNEPNKISLDFKGMDIVDVLKLLAQRGNMNISVSKNVRGKVTIFLKEVDINDAFEIILSSNDLAYEEKSGIINVMTERDYERLYGTNFADKKEIKIFHLNYAKASAVGKTLQSIKTKIGKIVIDESSNTIVMIDAPQAVAMAQEVIRSLDLPTETRIFGLDYAKAEDVKSKVEERLTEDIGTIQVDERTNKIVVTDLAEKMPELERVIAELDEKTQQVLIEAKIIQITLNDDFEMGVNWDYILHVGYNMATGVNFSNLSTILPAATQGVTGGAFEWGTLDDQRYQYVMQVLDSMGRTEILSAPRIVVINNEEASILVGSSRPYATTGTTIGETISETTQQVTYVDLGVMLHVTPTINRDGFITMKIKPEVSSRTEDITVTTGTGDDQVETKIPIIQTSTAETTVMVKDGNTIVIAGLIEDRNEESEDKIPVLGDIPLIGNVFKKRTIGSGDTTDAEKTELVIFLTPHIMSGEAMSPEVDKYLTTPEIGKSQMKKEPEKKSEPTRFAWFGKKEKVERLPKRAPVRKERALSSENYYNMVRSRVYQQARQNYPRSKVGGAAYVAFDLFSNGRLKGSPRILGYADETLKMLAVKSVYGAAPFPPFPADLDKPEETFKVLITYK